MPSTNDHNALSPGRSLWLEVHHDDRSHVFCCAPTEERAIVLGSLPRADIRVRGLGIAPVHFHFEREGDRIVLVPAYNAEVRVNSMLARGPVPIPEHALVEFAGLRLEALVRSTPSEHVDYPSLDIPDRESGISYLAALPTDTQTTKLALDAFSRVENLQAAIETRETPLEFRADSGTQRIERIEHHAELQTTQVMERLQLVTANTAAPPQQHTARMERIAPEASRAPAVEPIPVIEAHRLRPFPIVAVAAAEPLPTPPPPEVPSSPAGLSWQETTAFDLDGLRAELAPTPAPQSKTPPQQSAPVSPEPARPAQPRATSEKSSPLLTRSVRPAPSSGFARAVSRIGERTKAQPVVVSTVALGAAVTLALLMVGVSHVVDRSQRATASSPAQARDAARPNETATASTRTPSYKTPTTNTPPASLAIAPTPPAPTGAEQRGGAPGTALVVTAASHLVAGRYVDARAAYAQLGNLYPENPAFQAVTRLLDRRTSRACRGAGAVPSCPEIVQ